MLHTVASDATSPARRRTQAHLARRSATALLACVTAATTSVIAAQPALAGPDQDQYVYTRQHVDAPIPAWDARTHNLAVNASEHPASGVVLWVPRGWSGATPRHYFTIPRRDDFAFLGDADQTWYAAPQIPGTHNTPIWAGIGAHGSITENAHLFEAGNYVLDFVNVNGPGRVEAFAASTSVNRLWSSTDLGRRTVWNPRHMHHYTVFSKPGRYEVNVSAVARSKDGSRVYSSPVTPLVWQVGGTDPRQGKIKDYGAAYNAARATRTDGLPQGGTLTVEAKTRYLTAGDDRLTDITFETGNTTDNGRVIILINGFYLAELPVVNGRAGYDEFLGDENSTLQAIYIPEDATSARYMTTPVLYLAGTTTPLSSVGRATAVVPARPARSAVLEPNAHRIEDPDIHLSITPPSDTKRDYTVTIDGDSELNASVNVTFHVHATSDVIDCGIEKFMAHGIIETTADLNYCKDAAVMRVAVLPHPYSNAKPQVFELPRPQVAEGIDKTFTLQLREGTETFTQADKLPGFTPTPIVEDDTVTEAPGNATNPAHPGTPTLPPVVDTPATPAQTLGDKLAIHRGHLDLRLAQKADKTWAFVVKDDSLLGAQTSVLRDPSSVTVQVSPAARMTRNESMNAASLDFLGPIGTTNYVLPEVESTQLPWPGFSTEDIDYSAFPEGIQYTVRALAIPQGAQFFFATSSDLGGNVELLIDSRKLANSAIRTTEATHLHGSWVFSKAGRYELEVTARSGQTTIATAPLTFAVDMDHATDATPTQPGTGTHSAHSDNTGHSSTEPTRQTLSTNELARNILGNTTPGTHATPGTDNARTNAQGRSNTRAGSGSGVLGLLSGTGNTAPVRAAHGADAVQSADSAQSAPTDAQSAHLGQTPQSGTPERAAVTTLRAGGPQSGTRAQDASAQPDKATNGWSSGTLAALAAVAVLAASVIVIGLRAMRRSS